MKNKFCAGGQCDRRSFLRTAAAIGAASGVGGWGGEAGARLIRASEYRDAKGFLDAHFVVDFHAHPSLKTAFFKKDFYASHPAPPNTYPFTLRTDAPSLMAGGVKAVCSAVYVPERQIADDARILSAVGSLNPSIRRMKKSFAEEGPDVFAEIINQFETHVNAGEGARTARSLAELDRINRNGKIAILHTLEGGHALGSRWKESHEQMLRIIHARGVCMVTLAHFYDVGIAPNIQGVPKTWYLKALGCFDEQYASENSHAGLPDLGRRCVEAMLYFGMLVDLTHMTPEARSDVMDQVGTKSPLVMSHVGCRDLAPSRMNPDAAEIRRIADTGGVIGVIFLNYFLNGKSRGKGIEAIIDTMQCLIKHGGEDCVAWASDFDGFTNPPNDLREPSDLPRLAKRMLETFGEATTAKILGANVRRVLEEGWKSPV